ncbi:discoidin domain-containing protein [Arenibacter palladensis]|uniref:glycoside hydrolase family 38 N-terminal domain-containing protein n=1 Tax=Arenibacter palladensis TaxID=237373 RepID=UPI0026E19136|nr:discoidin domain-containing protein [Arenibacter palladensis]MDO6604124.1 discoidin domain-containing protein [Arenibacter palladensis]
MIITNSFKVIGRILSTLLFVVLTCVFAPEAAAQTTISNNVNEVNIALPKWGSSIRASSSFDPVYSPEKAIDGKWVTKADGADRRYVWNSESSQDAHWLILDFGQPRNIHKIVIRHEGVYDSGDKFNTSDFSLQYAISPEGPWKNLVDPVKKNTSNITTHEFTPKETHYVRLNIQKAEQNIHGHARIQEFEVYGNIDQQGVLVGAELMSKTIRQGKNEEEVKLVLSLYPKKGLNSYQHVSISSNSFETTINSSDFVVNKSGDWYDLIAWLPISALNEVIEIHGVKNGKKTWWRNLPIYYSEINNWGYMANGEVDIVCSSHQDIAWEDTPFHTADLRSNKCILPAMERMRKRADVTFSMENVLYIEEFLERHPELREEIFELTLNGNFDWGATYNQAYESLLSGEQLVREVYHGAKKIRKMIPGVSARVAYNVDVPGRSLQMPQILSKAEVPYLLMSRHKRGLFNWESPDGSSILCWSMGHYYDAHKLGSVTTTEEFMSIIDEKAKAWKPIYIENNVPPVNGVLFSMDYIGPADFDEYIDSSDKIRKEMRENGVNDNSPYFPPKFSYSSSEKFFDKIANSNAQLPTISGERPNYWLYIHGPSHHKAISSKRAAGVLLPAAESFMTIDGILNGTLADYPQEKFDKAWAASIYDDHGWGGNNGHVTDEVFKGKLDFAKQQGEELLDSALKNITKKINTDDQRGEAIVLFNALSWERTDPVTATITSANGRFGIVDHAGNLVDHQIIEKRNDEYVVNFIAENIPSMGYKTYYVSKSQKNKNSPDIAATDENYTNQFYRLEFGSGGIEQIWDKELGKELIDNKNFKAGEVFTMQSVGNGAGEFFSIQKPDMEGFDKVSLHNPEWKLVANGLVFAKYEQEQQMKDCRVRQQIIIYHQVKRIDFNIDILGWNGTKYREFRLALPLKMKDSKVTYEVPMGTVTIGEDEMPGFAGGRYWPDNKNVHPREVQNFISTNNDDIGVTLSSSVSVFDHLDPTDYPIESPTIQPILLASRKSCHWNGNWYLQQGDHHYSFSLSSHQAGWENGYKQAIQANNPILPVNSQNKKGTLPAEKSFVSVSQANTLVSTVKKCDDDEDVVIRVYDIEGIDNQVEINTFFSISKAQRTNIIEENGITMEADKNSLNATIGHHAIETFKLNLGNN